MDDEKKETKQKQSPSPFTLTISVIQKQLNIIVQDTTTKQVYKSSFNANALKKAGFNDHQIENIPAIQKLIETAKSQRNDLKLVISIQKTDGKKDEVNVNDDPDDAEGGVHGIDITRSENIAAPAIVVSEYALIKIIKKDDFFGDRVFKLKLDKVARNESVINKEMIQDIIKEIGALKNGLNKIKDLEIKLEESDQRARAEQEKIEKLEKESRAKEIRIKEMENISQSQQIEIEGLREKLKDLENKTQEQQRKIIEIEEGANLQRGKIENIAILTRDIRKLEKSSNEKEREIKDLGEKSKRIDLKINKLEKDTNKLNVIETEMKKEREEKKEDNQNIIHYAKYSTDLEREDIRWNIERCAPTLNEMVTRENDNKKLVFGVAGIYRIVYRWSSKENVKEGDRGAGLYLNGEWIAYSINYNCNGFGQITEIVNVKVGDYINCYCENKKGTDPDYFALIIERMGDSN